MEFRKPKAKKKLLLQGELKLPFKEEKEIIGVFNGDYVTVNDLDSMIYLYEAGNYGKGSLSKGEPNYCLKRDDIPKIVFHHQFVDQTKWNVHASSCQQEMFLRSGNSDLQLSFQSLESFLQSSFRDANQESWKSWKGNHEKQCQNLKKNVSHKVDLSFLKLGSKADYDYEDEYLKSMVNDILELKELKKPTNAYSETNKVIVVNASVNSPDVSAKLDRLPCTPVENLNLNLEESLFLKSVFGCLNILENLTLREMKVADLWEKFKSVRKNFPERYVTYHYYRTKGWIVRSGLKFGGDFLLYKSGPAHYHASYLVKVLDGRKKLTWREFLAMNRLVETFNKDLILSYVYFNSTLKRKSFRDVLLSCSIQEILVKRWFPSKERLLKGKES